MIGLLALACGEVAPPPPARVVVPIRSPADFPAAALRVHAVAAGGVEVVLEAGRYEGHLELVAEGPVDLVLRGTGDVRFDGGTVTARARTVQVAGLAFGGRPGTPVLAVEVERSAQLTDLRLAGLAPSVGDHDGVALVELIAAGPEAVARIDRLEVVDSGFDRAVVVRLAAQPRSGWAELAVGGGGGADWTGRALLSLSRVEAVAIHDGEWALPPGALLVDAETPTRGALSGNRMVLDGPDALGAWVQVDRGVFFARDGRPIRGIVSTPGADDEARRIAERLR